MVAFTPNLTETDISESPKFQQSFSRLARNF